MLTCDCFPVEGTNAKIQNPNCDIHGRQGWAVDGQLVLPLKTWESPEWPASHRSWEDTFFEALVNNAPPIERPWSDPGNNPADDIRAMQRIMSEAERGDPLAREFVGDVRPDGSTVKAGEYPHQPFDIAGNAITVDRMLHDPTHVARRIMDMQRQEELWRVWSTEDTRSRLQKIRGAISHKVCKLRDRLALKIAPWLDGDMFDV